MPRKLSRDSYLLIRLSSCKRLSCVVIWILLSKINGECHTSSSCKMVKLSSHSLMIYHLKTIKTIMMSIVLSKLVELNFKVIGNSLVLVMLVKRIH